MSTLLERRYRHLLRMLPPAYRAAREEEMVATYLDGVPDTEEEHLGRPRLDETLAVASLAVRVRLGGAGASPRSQAWGRTLRLVALLGFAAQAAQALSGVLVELALWLSGAAGAMGMAPPGSSPKGLAHLAVQAGWVAAFVLLVLGRRRVVRVLAVVLVGVGLAPYADPVRLEGTLAAWTNALGEASGLLAAVLPVLALAAFHRDAPRPDRRWLWGLAAGPALVVLPSSVPGGMAFDGLVAAFLAGAAVHWAASRRSARAPHVPLALVIVGVPLLGLQVVSVVALRAMRASHDPALGGPPPVGLIEAGTVALAVVLALLLATAVRALRRLPAAGPGRSSRA